MNGNHDLMRPQGQIEARLPSGSPRRPSGSAIGPVGRCTRRAADALLAIDAAAYVGTGRALHTCSGRA
jgi:hypothetical protein